MIAGRHGLPVMFWIHGGGLISGSSNPYNPGLLVKKGVIVVTINYRLGYLGFFAQSAIDAEDHLKGNYGLMDHCCCGKGILNRKERYSTKSG